ncbi:MAG: formyltransferase family protein [Solidesulfovibrio sp. DCME]|uniref:formyltransferase family protein n=1 Tax=Solidesulfovibrio sp. DCME TaxID=3447380 RepID=UPI003D10B385
MRILVCSKLDLAGVVALNAAARLLAGHELHFLLSDRVTALERRDPGLAELLFFERDLPVEHLFPALDRAPFAPGAAPECHTVAGLTRHLGIPVRLRGDVNQPQTVAEIRALAPDVILSVRYEWIFKDAVLAIPRCGLYNVHPGELPGYGGVLAPFRAALAGEPQAAVTLHVIDRGLDTGPIVDIRRLPFTPGRSIFDVTVGLYPLGIALFRDILPRIEAGEPVPATPQDPAARRYFSFPTQPEFQALAAKGVSLLDLAQYRQLLSRFEPGSGLGQPCGDPGAAGACGPSR